MPTTRAAFGTWWWEDLVEKGAAIANTRSRSIAKERAKARSKRATENKGEEIQLKLKEEINDFWTYLLGKDLCTSSLEEDWMKHSQLLLSMDPKLEQAFTNGYELNSGFKNHLLETILNPNVVLTPSRFQKGGNGLLYFVDTDLNTQLCIPKSRINFVLNWIHKTPCETTHAGPWKLLSQLQELFYWPSM